MKTILVLLITVFIISLQFNLGLKKKYLLGSITPIIFLLLFVSMSYINKTLEYVGTGIGCILAFILTWLIGRMKSRKHEKNELDRMKIKDL